MTYDRTERIRRAAILVASLDDVLAERLLAELPPVQRERVLEYAEQLEEIDLEEQQDVLAEFRRVTRSGPGAVEFQSSRSAATLAGELSADHSSEAASSGRGDALSPPDAAAMAELLACEHPQIVAAALSRLGEDQCAAVFAELPADLQSDALERLAALAPVDETAVQEIESQLQFKLQQRKEHLARSAAGAELVQKILARTAPAQRARLLERMAAKADAPARDEAPRAAGGPLSRPAAIDPLAKQAFDLAAAVHEARTAQQRPAVVVEDRSAELDQLDDEALVAALRAADEPTVLRALAASGESFLNRVMNMLPRRQARTLRRMLRNLGPTRLADLHEAQSELLRLAHERTAAEVAA